MSFVGFEPNTVQADGSAWQTNDRIERANLYTVGLEASVEFVLGDFDPPEIYLDGTRPDVWLLTPHLGSENRVRSRPGKVEENEKKLEMKESAGGEKRTNGVNDTVIRAKTKGSMTLSKHTEDEYNGKVNDSQVYSNAGAPKNTSVL